jgi:hypothetical protein
VKNFYATLVKARAPAFLDAKNQAERWMQAVVLPLEVQMKDHKAQLQSRLDNLAKINEKTTLDQRADGQGQGPGGGPAQAARDDRGPDPARLRARGQGQPLRQRPDPAARSQRVGRLDARHEIQRRRHGRGLRRAGDDATEGPPPLRCKSPRPSRRPAPSLVSDDFMSQIEGLKPGTAPEKKPAAAPAPAPAQAFVPAGAFDPESTQNFDPESTQKFPPGALDTQKMPAGAMDTQKMPAGAMDTQKMAATDPTITQRLPTDTQKLPPATDRTKTVKLPEK